METQDRRKRNGKAEVFRDCFTGQRNKSKLMLWFWMLSDRSV